MMGVMSMHVPVPSRAAVLAVITLGVLSSASTVLFEMTDFGQSSTLVQGLISIAVLSLSINVYVLIRGRRYGETLARSMTKEIASSQQLFTELFKNSPVPYVLIDHRGNITLPNIASVRLFGKEAGELTGLNIFDLTEVVTKEGEEIHAALVRTRFEQGVNVNDEDVRIHRADGTTRWALLSIFSYGSFGRHKNGLLTLVDITKQKEVDRAKTEFVSLASHQLHTPISSMKWNIELLVSKRFGDLSEPQYAYVEKIERALGRMEAIIKDFLNVTQLELGTVVTDIAPLNIVEEFEDMFEEQTGRINLKHITIERDYGEESVIIMTDKRLFRTAIGNLISNAVKYTSENGIVRVRCAALDGRTITIEVSDTGIGIPTEDQEQLFTKFFRATNARAEEPDGTGLGLYIVALALKFLGGSVTFISRKDEGTTFTVVLPR
jgi:PAS domain S-box-containing protein